MTRSLIVLAAVSLALAGCGGGGSTSAGTVPTGGSGTASVDVSLVDGPFRTSGGTVTAVNIAVAKVEAVGANGVQTIATFSPAQPINLLSYTSQSSPLQLGTASIPAGQYQQLRLVLDDSSPNNTSVVIDGTTYPLTIPSATAPAGFSNATSTDAGDGPGTAGIKVNVGLNAQAGQSYGFVIDFNAAESIVSSGASGKYLMKPVLVATAQAQAGSISGTVKDTAGTTPVMNAEVLAQQNGTTINSGVTDSSGAFSINALPVGSYTLVVNNQWTSQSGATNTATGADGTAPVTYPSPVPVTNGQATTVSISD
ncbi:MAG TPA: DUF4382 domain-containing protein [Candidatus Limnocylindria bacterium]|jgi:hypothetical protein|nr:DUF4382 domain-containing protein [Candidatus Limnocylindria bacterium]